MQELMEYFNELLEKPENQRAVTVAVDRIMLADFVAEKGILLSGPHAPKQQSNE
jgi:hypothetical protein